MSKPFELILSDGYGNAHIGTCQYEDPENKLYDFMATKPLDESFDYQLRFDVETTTKIIQQYDIIWVNTPNHILLSSKAIQILNELCPEQFQVFDATIECKGGVVDNYKTINILNEVNVSDPEKSRYTKYTKSLDPNESISGYERGGFVINDQPIEPIHIGREKHSHATIIISATLKEAFEKAKIKGGQYWAGD